MPGPRKLWTGPTGAGIRDRAIGRASAEASTLYLVPSPMARDQVNRVLGARSRGADAPRVWCWDDAWKATARALAEPPARLSLAGRIAVQGDAIARAVEWPGYRRRLLERFAAWTLEERAAGRPAPSDEAVDREEWAVFGHYRAILTEIGAEDPEGFAAWASRTLFRKPPPELARPGHVVAIEPTAPTRAAWRLLQACHERARSMTVTLPFDPEPVLAELYAGVEPARRRFLEWGFEEEADRVEGFSFRPPGPDFIERELFRSDVLARPRLARSEGLKIVGGPRGEGQALLIAREVADRIDGGTPPEDVLILVPRLDEDAERIREALASWGLPVAPAPARRLSTVPAVSTLRQAIRLPVDRWEVSNLVRLLRNGRVRWSGGALSTAFGPSEAASAIRSTRVFRDRDRLRQALAVGLDRKPKDRPTLAALDALDRLSSWLDPVARPGPWPVQVERLGRLADSLGLAPAELDPLRDALEDRGWVLARLGPAVAQETRSWADFVEEVEALIAEVDTPDPSPVPGTIRIEPVGASEGARARVVILANLAERTFPSPGSVSPDPEPESAPAEGDEPAVGPNLAYSREMLRFARVAGSAEDGLILSYPTTDLNGEPLLPAGFLDDLIRRLGDRAAGSVERHARFDPVLAGHDRLARSPADARVLAVALACRDVDADRLRALAGSPAHAAALGGTADAFAVASRRRDDRSFGPYDGRLRDTGALIRIAGQFGPTHAFSPSQLETFALSPFQFFQRYVLGLKVVDERQELDEDYAGRGSQVHDSLERIHQQIASEGASNVIERLGILIETDMRVELERHDGAEADVAEVLREIATRRTNKTLARYLGQYRAYASRPGETPDPHQFEVLFGQPDNELSHPHLTIGGDGETVLLQGKIDRVDLIRTADRVRFRVIDYKTGSSPTGRDVHAGLASQLPLYALAVERLGLAPGDLDLIDVGYWSLPRNGYQGVKIADWPGYRDRLMAFVIGLVGELRGGSFPVDSRKKDCPKFCDFRSACRVSEVRMAGKARDDRPTLEVGP